MVFEIENINIKKYKLPYSIKNKKILIISDLHNNRFGKNNNKLKSAVDMINADAVIVAGDLFNGVGKNENSIDFLKFLVKKHIVYMVKGNHEDNISYSNMDMYEFITNYGKTEKNFILLDNNHVDLWGVKLYGFTSDEESYKRMFAKKICLKEIEKKLGIADNNCYNIVVSHNPSRELVYKEWGANLIICGHLHGGFIRIFNKGLLTPQLIPFPKYTSGRYKLGTDCELVVSRGLGTHFPIPRLFNKPHMIVLEFM